MGLCGVRVTLTDVLWYASTWLFPFPNHWTEKTVTMFLRKGGKFSAHLCQDSFSNWCLDWNWQLERGIARPLHGQELAIDLWVDLGEGERKVDYETGIFWPESRIFLRVANDACLLRRQTYRDSWKWKGISHLTMQCLRSIVLRILIKSYCTGLTAQINFHSRHLRPMPTIASLCYILWLYLWNVHSSTR